MSGDGTFATLAIVPELLRRNTHAIVGYDLQQAQSTHVARPVRPDELRFDDLMCAVEVTDAHLGPAIAPGRAYSEPIEQGSDSVIRQRAGELANQLFGRYLRRAIRSFFACNAGAVHT